MNTQRDLINASARVMIAGIAGLAAQPIIAHPDVLPYLILGAQALTCVAVAGGAGFVWQAYLDRKHRRFPAPAMSQAAQFAATHAATPEMEHAQHEERLIEADGEQGTERDYHNRVVRFCVIGASKRSFGWNAMSGLVNRPGWDQLTGDLCAAGVLVIGRGTRPTWFAHGWSCGKVWQALSNGRLTLPLPDPLPEVNWT